MSRLLPLALDYKKKLELVTDAIGEGVVAILKPLLLDLFEAHQRFQEIFTTECEVSGPSEPFTILHHYPSALRLYFIAFFRALPGVSFQLYGQWKEAVANQESEMLVMIPRLTILYLLEYPNELIPELFVANEKEIDSLRQVYQGLALEHKRALQAALRGESEPSKEVCDLFKRIGRMGELQNQVMNGVARIFFEESTKCFALLDQMRVDKPPQGLESQYRIVFLAFLKQPDCENLPYDFIGGKIEEVIKVIHERYHQLSENDRIEFDHLFLNHADNAKNILIYRMLRDWKEVFFYWGERKQFPLSLLSQIAYELWM